MGKVSADRKDTGKAKSLYFVALLLPPALTAEVTGLKENFARTYGPRHALKLLPHITLVAPFRSPPGKEAALAAALEAFLKGRTSFPVRLNGFGSFLREEGATFFIRVEAGPGLEQLHEGLEHCVGEVLLLPPPPPRTFRPHVSIAHRDLDGETARRVIRKFGDNSFAAAFDASCISLLRHDGEYWQQLRQYVLAG